LIDAGELACERIGNRRKVLLKDLVEYREARRQRQYDLIADTLDDLDDDEDPRRGDREAEADPHTTAVGSARLGDLVHRSATNSLPG
jgi:hypothetical protein